MCCDGYDSLGIAAARPVKCVLVFFSLKIKCSGYANFPTNPIISCLPRSKSMTM